MNAIQIKELGWMIAQIERDEAGQRKLRYFNRKLFQSRDEASVTVNKLIQKSADSGKPFVRADFQIHYVEVQSSIKTIDDPKIINDHIKISEHFKRQQAESLKALGLNGSLQKTANIYLSQGFLLFENEHKSFLTFEVDIPPGSIILFKGDITSSNCRIIAYCPGYPGFIPIENFKFPDPSDVAEKQGIL